MAKKHHPYMERFLLTMDDTQLVKRLKEARNMIKKNEFPFYYRTLISYIKMEMDKRNIKYEECDEDGVKSNAD